MPSLRKLSEAEIAALEQPALGSRARVAQEYNAYLTSFAIGNYGRAELHEGERRDVVRTRLHAAAGRRGLVLHFRPGPGAAMIFHVVVPQAVGVALVGAQRDEVAESNPMPRRSLRRRGSAAERYREVLPRWMRESGKGDRRIGSKRSGGGKT